MRARKRRRFDYGDAEKRQLEQQVRISKVRVRELEAAVSAGEGKRKQKEKQAASVEFELKKKVKYLLDKLAKRDDTAATEKKKLEDALETAKGERGARATYAYGTVRATAPHTSRCTVYHAPRLA